jgi:hypothetical protein
MALTKTQQAPQASTSRAAGAATTTSAWYPIGYGVSVVARMTNGATGPTVGCSFWVDLSADGAIPIITLPAVLHPITSGLATTYGPYDLGVGVGGGNFAYYRTNFGGNTGQAVTVQADAQTTAGL